MSVNAKSSEIYFEFFIAFLNRCEHLMIQIRYYTTLHRIFKCSFCMSCIEQFFNIVCVTVILIFRQVFALVHLRTLTLNVFCVQYDLHNMRHLWYQDRQRKTQKSLRVLISSKKLIAKIYMFRN